MAVATLCALHRVPVAVTLFAPVDDLVAELYLLYFFAFFHFD